MGIFFGCGILCGSCKELQCWLTWLTKKNKVEDELKKKTKEEQMLLAVVVRKEVVQMMPAVVVR